MGVAGAEGQGKEQAEHSPQNRQQGQGRRQGGKPRPSEEGRDPVNGGAPFPDCQPGGSQQRHNMHQPPGVQPYPRTEADPQQGAAVDGSEQRAQSGGTGPQTPGHQPAWQNQIEGGGTEKPHRPKQRGSRQGDDGQISGKAEAGQDPGQKNGQGRSTKPRGSGTVKDRDGSGQGGEPPLYNNEAAQQGKTAKNPIFHFIIT